MTKWADSNDEQVVAQWWLERNPEPRDLGWRDLDEPQRVLLTAWYAMGMDIPEPTEELPLEYMTALSEILRAAGRPPERGFMRHRIQPGVAPNHRRRVRARKRNGQLA